VRARHRSGFQKRKAPGALGIRGSPHSLPVVPRTDTNSRKALGALEALCQQNSRDAVPFGEPKSAVRSVRGRENDDAS
jgi:hypothetical protein